jgi:DNA-binding FadR family transcriptional regulator
VIHRDLLMSMATVAPRMENSRPLGFHKAIYTAIADRRRKEASRKMVEHLQDARSFLLSGSGKKRAKPSPNTISLTPNHPS